MKKVKEFLKNNKEEILISYLVLTTAILIISVLINIMLVSISTDLVNVIEEKDSVIQESAIDNAYNIRAIDWMQQQVNSCQKEVTNGEGNNEE